MANPVTEAYVERCLREGGGLRDALSEVEFGPGFAKGYGYRLLDRPVFVDAAQARAFGTDLAAFFELVVSLPDRLFGGDFTRYCAHLGLGGARVDLMRAYTARPAVYGRADAYHDGSSFKLLELNLGSRVGGLDLVQMCKALLGVPAFRAFADEHKLSYVDTPKVLADLLREAASRTTGSTAPVAAVIDLWGILADFMPMLRSLEEAMAEHGVEFVFADINELSRQGGRIRLRGRPIDVVLRYFTDEELVEDAQANATFETVCRADEAGEVVLWTTLQSELHANKACLNLLSDPAYRGEFSAGEIELADRVLPWTRALTGHADLVDHCRAHRANLVLKPQSDFGGNGVLAGWTATDAEWSEALRERAGGGHIVQERVVPEPEPVVDRRTGEIADWAINWGVFLTPDGYGGAFGRGLPLAESAVIGAAVNSGTRLTGVFSAP